MRSILEIQQVFDHVEKNMSNIPAPDLYLQGVKDALSWVNGDLDSAKASFVPRYLAAEES